MATSKDSVDVSVWSHRVTLRRRLPRNVTVDELQVTLTDTSAGPELFRLVRRCVANKQSPCENTAAQSGNARRDTDQNQ